MSVIFFAIEKKVLDKNPLIKKEPPPQRNPFYTEIHPSFTWRLEKDKIACGIVRQTAGDMLDELRKWAGPGHYKVCQGTLSDWQIMFMTNMIIAGSEPTNLDIDIYETFEVII